MSLCCFVNHFTLSVSVILCTFDVFTPKVIVAQVHAHFTVFHLIEIQFAFGPDLVFIHILKLIFSY